MSDGISTWNRVAVLWPYHRGPSAGGMGQQTHPGQWCSCRVALPRMTTCTVGLRHQGGDGLNKCTGDWSFTLHVNFSIDAVCAVSEKDNGSTWLNSFQAQLYKQGWKTSASGNQKTEAYFSKEGQHGSNLAPGPQCPVSLLRWCKCSRCCSRGSRWSCTATEHLTCG